MKKIALILFLSSCFAMAQPQLAVTNAYAHYKGQFGGGTYSIEKVDYMTDAQTGDYRLHLILSKDLKHGISQEQQEIIYVHMVNQFQLEVLSDSGQMAGCSSTHRMCPVDIKTNHGDLHIDFKISE